MHRYLSYGNIQIVEKKIVNLKKKMLHATTNWLYDFAGHSVAGLGQSMYGG